MFPRRHVSPPRLDRPGCRRRGPPAPAVAAPAVAAAAAVAGAADGLQRPSAAVSDGVGRRAKWSAVGCDDSSVSCGSYLGVCGLFARCPVPGDKKRR